jgi:hypothetical protein
MARIWTRAPRARPVRLLVPLLPRLVVLLLGPLLARLLVPPLRARGLARLADGTRPDRRAQVREAGHQGAGPDATPQGGLRQTRQIRGRGLFARANPIVSYSHL